MVVGYSFTYIGPYTCEISRLNKGDSSKRSDILDFNAGKFTYYLYGFW